MNLAQVVLTGRLLAPQVVFSKFNSLPNTKMLTFYRKDTFTLTAAYSDEAMAEQPSGFPQRINEYVISNIPPGPLGDDGTPGPAKIKVKLRLDIHGCLVLESAVALEEADNCRPIGAGAA